MLLRFVTFGLEGVVNAVGCTCAGTHIADDIVLEVLIREIFGAHGNFFGFLIHGAFEATGHGD